MEPSSEREEAVCGRGAWQGACLPHSRLCPQVGGLTWFSGLLLIPAVHYGNIFEYLSLWSEVQFLNIQKSKKIQEIQKPN